MGPPAALLFLAWSAIGPAHARAVPEEATEIVASRRGFKPDVVNLRRGDTVRVALSTSDVEHCFAVDALRIEKRIVPGRKTFVELTPDRAGTFPFYCCLEPGSEALRGRLVVSE